MAWPPERHPQTRGRAPSRRAETASHRLQLRRNRFCLGWRASAGLPHPGSRRQARVPLPRGLARGGARVHDEWLATRAQASPVTRTVPRVVSYRYSLSLLEAEFGGIDLTAALEVHPHPTASVRGKNAIHVLRSGDRSAVDLDDHIARLKADLLLHPITDSVYQSSLSALNLVLGADRSRKCDQLDLAQNGYSRSVHIRQVHDSNGDGNLAGSTLDHDRVILANAQLEELGVPIVWIMECPVLRAHNHIAGHYAGARCRRARDDRRDNNASTGTAYSRAAGELRLNSDPWPPDNTVGEKILGDPSGAINRDREPDPNRPPTRRKDRAVDSDH